VSESNGILKPWKTLQTCELPNGADQDQAFFVVDTMGTPITKISGTCNSVLSDATGFPNSLTDNNPQAGSAATWPKPDSGPAFACGDQILLIDQNNNTDPLGPRAVEDWCDQKKMRQFRHVYWRDGRAY
jgi:hypothetical protein